MRTRNGQQGTTTAEAEETVVTIISFHKTPSVVTTWSDMERDESLHAGSRNN